MNKAKYIPPVVEVIQMNVEAGYQTSMDAFVTPPAMGTDELWD